MTDRFEIRSAARSKVAVVILGLNSIFQNADVNVKPKHGGGLGPVVGGEDHLPAENETVQAVFTLIPRWQPTVLFL